MPLVSVIIKVEEIAFIPVLRALHNLPGVAAVDFNMDDLGHRSGSARKPKQVTKTDGETMSASQLLVTLMAQGPQHLAVLKKGLADAGFSVKGISSALNELRKAGISETGGIGIHKLTEKAMSELNAERKALPAPMADPTKPRLPTRQHNGSLLILRAMQAANAPMGRAALTTIIAEVGLATRSLDNALYRIKERGLIKPGETKGFYELTAKGRKFQLPAEINQEE